MSEECLPIAFYTYKRSRTKGIEKGVEKEVKGSVDL